MNDSPYKYESADDCPDRESLHTTCPTSYIAWHDWSEEMGKTHRQVRCPTCGFFSIWLRNAALETVDETCA